ncbi:SagB family peptide dehydrogenase [Streptomyces sp. NPDC059631]|uniref:SagB family peptide dehydrogenase n=1 Tax=unclassified Streptomyces TaxID=2593676 RepID=UPI0036AABD6A
MTAPAPAAGSGTRPPSDETGGAAARRYHARYGSVLPAIDPAAGSTLPKHLPGARVLPLPYPPAFPPAPSADRPSPSPDQGLAPDPQDLGHLGALLALLNGVTRADWTDGRVRAGRPVPSGGGAYPGEVYVATASGLCHYLPAAHALELLSEADLRADLAGALSPPPAVPPEVLLLISSRLGANLARYGPFGHRLQALDTGVLAGQALTLLESAGAAPTAHALFAQERVGRLLGLDAETEHVHAVVTAGRPGPVASATALLNRRTARAGYEPVPVPLALVLGVLDRAARPVALDHTAPADCDLYVVAHRVTGLAPGCHRRDPRTGRLVPVADGVSARELFPAGGPGELAAFEAACAVVVTGNYEAGYPVYGDRWYRMLNLRAGVLGQRIGLAAARAGLGAGLRCDTDTGAADAALRTPPDRTTLLAALLGPERGAGAPSHHLLFSPGVPPPPTG